MDFQGVFSVLAGERSGGFSALTLPLVLLRLPVEEFVDGDVLRKLRGAANFFRYLHVARALSVTARAPLVHPLHEGESFLPRLPLGFQFRLGELQRLPRTDGFRDHRAAMEEDLFVGVRDFLSEECKAPQI